MCELPLHRDNYGCFQWNVCLHFFPRFYLWENKARPQEMPRRLFPSVESFFPTCVLNLITEQDRCGAGRAGGAPLTTQNRICCISMWGYTEWMMYSELKTILSRYFSLGINCITASLSSSSHSIISAVTLLFLVSRNVFTPCVVIHVFFNALEH